MVVNGLHEEDWNTLKTLASDQPMVVPAYGYHPWYLEHASTSWVENLEHKLSFHGSVIGEIGLDRRKQNTEFTLQEKFFRIQLELAASFNLTASIHCIDAWGALLSILKESKIPSRGFLMHSYGGALELVPQLIKLGAYFSFPGHFLHQEKRRKLETFKVIPLERLLIETDAPDQPPPATFNDYPLNSDGAKKLNNPANIVATYRGLAAELHVDLATLALQVERNFLSLFGDAVIE